MSNEVLMALVRQAINGNTEDFNRLCEAKVKDILYICIKLTDSFEDGQDAAQEVLIAMQRSLPALKNPQAFPAWLNRIIARTCAHVRAREGTLRGHLPIEGLEDTIMEDGIEFLPSEFAEDKEARQTVLQCMRALPQKHQHILLLFYFEQMNLKEIAEAMEISHGAARTLLHRARSALKVKVEKAQNQPIQPQAKEYGLVPTLALILRKEAAQIATEETARQVLVASGVTAAGAAVAGGTVAAGVAGSATTTAAGTASAAAAGVAATGAAVVGTAGVVSTIVAAAGVALCGTVLAGSIYLVGSSSPPVASEMMPDPQLASLEAQAGEDEFYIWEPETSEAVVPAEASSSSPTSVYKESEPSTSTQGDGKRPAPTKHTLAGHVRFVDKNGTVQEHEGLSLGDIAVELLQNGQVLAQTVTEADGGYQLGDVPIGSYTLRAKLPDGSAYVLVQAEVDVYADSSLAPDITLTDTAPPLAGIRYYDALGTTQAHSRAPASAQIQHLDHTPATLHWQLFEGTVLLAQGTSESIPLQGDTVAKATGRRLLLVAEVTDLAGNTTLVERPVYLS